MYARVPSGDVGGDQQQPIATRSASSAHLVDADRRPLDRPLAEPYGELGPGSVRGTPPLLRKLVVREPLVDPLVVAVVHQAVVEGADGTAADHSPELEPDLCVCA